MNRKKIVKIPCQLMTKEVAIGLQLEEQPYLIIIPRSILQKHGINEEEMSFQLVIEENQLCLIRD